MIYNWRRLKCLQKAKELLPLLLTLPGSAQQQIRTGLSLYRERVNEILHKRYQLKLRLISMQREQQVAARYHPQQQGETYLTPMRQQQQTPLSVSSMLMPAPETSAETHGGCDDEEEFIFLLKTLINDEDKGGPSNLKPLGLDQSGGQIPAQTCVVGQAAPLLASSVSSVQDTGLFTDSSATGRSPHGETISDVLTQIQVRDWGMGMVGESPLTMLGRA